MCATRLWPANWYGTRAHKSAQVGSSQDLAGELLRAEARQGRQAAVEQPGQPSGVPHEPRRQPSRAPDEPRRQPSRAPHEPSRQPSRPPQPRQPQQAAVPLEKHPRTSSASASAASHDRAARPPQHGFRTSSASASAAGYDRDARPPQHRPSQDREALAADRLALLQLRREED